MNVPSNLHFDDEHDRVIECKVYGFHCIGTHHDHDCGALPVMSQDWVLKGSDPGHIHGCQPCGWDWYAEIVADESGELGVREWHRIGCPDFMCEHPELTRPQH